MNHNSQTCADYVIDRVERERITENESIRLTRIALRERDVQEVNGDALA